MNVAIIPARKGSKSIINKNLKKIGGKTLVERTILSAIDSGVFDKIILTTDIPTLVDDYADSRQVIVRPRANELSGDMASMVDVVVDVLKCFKFPNPLCWLLQPTAPFRKKSDYAEIAKAFRADMTRSLISLSRVGDNHPNRMYTIKNNILHPLRFTNFENKQALPEVFIRSGHYYVFYQNDFLKEKKFYLHPCSWILIDEERAVNIDGPVDLLLAQKIYAEGILK